MFFSALRPGKNFPALRPPMFLGALRLMFKQASFSRMIFRAELLGMFLSAYSGQRFLSKLPFPREAGIATRHDLGEGCVFQLKYVLIGERRTVDG